MSLTAGTNYNFRADYFASHNYYKSLEVSIKYLNEISNSLEGTSTYTGAGSTCNFSLISGKPVLTTLSYANSASFLKMADMSTAW